MIEIKNAFNLKVIFKSKKAKSIKEVVEEAVEKRADLMGANLRGASGCCPNLKL